MAWTTSTAATGRPACQRPGHAAASTALQRDPSLVGHRPGPGHSGKTGIAPVIVGRPVGDLFKQVELDPAMDGRHCQDGVTDLVVVPAAELALRQVVLDQTLLGDGPVTAHAALVDRMGPGGETSPGKVLFFGWRGGLVERVEDIRPGLDGCQKSLDCLTCLFVSRLMPRAHGRSYAPRPLRRCPEAPPSQRPPGLLLSFSLLFGAASAQGVIVTGYANGRYAVCPERRVRVM